MKIEISNGELVDKVAILSIKLEKIASENKRANVLKEYRLLIPKMAEIGITTDSEVFRRLKQVNLKLWEIEDTIRKKEAEGVFDKEFIQLARSVYFENDRRSRIKHQINLQTRSNLIEEKEYVEYQ